MNIRIKIVLFLCFICNETQSQDVYNERTIYHKNFTNRFESVISDNTFIYVVGTSSDTIPPHYGAGIFYKINIESKEILDKVQIRDPDNDIDFTAFGNNMFIEGDSLYYVGGGYTVWPVRFSFQMFSYNIKNGGHNLRSVPGYDHKGNQFLRHSDYIKTENGYFLLNKFQDSITLRSDLLITHTDSKGQELWKKIYPDERTLITRSIYLDQQNQIIMGGSYLYESAGSQESYLSLMKIDSTNGDLIKEYEHPSLSSSARALIEDQETSGYIVGSDVAKVERNRFITYRPRIMKVDADLDHVIWQIDLDTRYSDIPFHLDEITYIGDNNYIGVGKGYNDAGDRIFGRIVKFTGNGSLIWDKTVSFFSNTGIRHWFHDVTPHKDGFVACGQINRVGFSDTIISPLQAGWVVYFDKDGNTDITSPTDVITLDNGIVDIFPNPASDYIEMRFEEALREDVDVEIVDLSGRLSSSFCIPKLSADHQEPITYLSSGTYLVRMQLKGRIVVKKLVVE